MDQFGAGQIGRKLGVSKRIFQILRATRACSPREDFGAHPSRFRMASTMPPGIDRLKSGKSRVYRWKVCCRFKTRWEKRRERAGLLDGPAEHSATRQIYERAMELRIQLDIAVRTFP